MKKRFSIFAALIAAVMLIFSACSSDNSQPAKPSAQAQGQAQTETAFQQQSTAVPYPADQLKDSLERRNLVERLLRFNKPDKIGYLYLQNNLGGFIGFYTIKGKVSSTDSQLTTDQLIQGCPDHRGETPCGVVVNAPGDDGSYGPNEHGIFFFTTEGVMVETGNPNWIYEDAPLPVQAPQLNLATDKPSSTAASG